MISDAEKFLSNNTTNDTQKKTVSLTDLIYEKLLNAEKKEKVLFILILNILIFPNFIYFSHNYLIK
jgi:UV DNA damage repair endonuclease